MIDGEFRSHIAFVDSAVTTAETEAQAQRFSVIVVHG